ncbi:MAG: c-type cytochrome domain-containing protein, partial [Planctomycetales bacterium]
MTKMRLSAVAGFVLVTIASNLSAAEVPAHVREFVNAHCVDCHDADTARAGFRIDTLGADFTAGNTANSWLEVMGMINSGRMPPKDS